MATPGSSPAIDSSSETRTFGDFVLRGSPSARVAAGLVATLGDGGRIAGCTVAEALRIAGRDRAGEVVSRFPELADRLRAHADTLSGGEQQILQVACAWCLAPKALVLDAPTLGLAESAGARVRELARDAAAAGTAVLWLDTEAAAAPFGVVRRLAGGRLSPPAGAGGSASAS